VTDTHPTEHRGEVKHMRTLHIAGRLGTVDPERDLTLGFMVFCDQADQPHLIQVALNAVERDQGGIGVGVQFDGQRTEVVNDLKAWRDALDRAIAWAEVIEYGEMADTEWDIPPVTVTQIHYPE